MPIKLGSYTTWSTSETSIQLLSSFYLSKVLGHVILWCKFNPSVECLNFDLLLFVVALPPPHLLQLMKLRSLLMLRRSSPTLSRSMKGGGGELGSWTDPMDFSLQIMLNWFSEFVHSVQCTIATGMAVLVHVVCFLILAVFWCDVLKCWIGITVHVPSSHPHHTHYCFRFVRKHH